MANMNLHTGSGSLGLDEDKWRLYVCDVFEIRGMKIEFKFIPIVFFLSSYSAVFSVYYKLYKKNVRASEMKKELSKRDVA